MQIREMHELSMLIGIGAKNWKFQPYIYGFNSYLLKNLKL
jgi:hypothetical protein